LLKAGPVSKKADSLRSAPLCPKPAPIRALRGVCQEVWILTNEQLAKIAEERLRTQAEFARIPGVGEARAAKYAEEFLAVVEPRAVGDDNKEAKKDAAPKPTGAR
jgi:hypothetical protein